MDWAPSRGTSPGAEQKHWELAQPHSQSDLTIPVLSTQDTVAG